jgi:ABC-type nitrate/sulfonate/bicarbonate transport system substrate-binding protein
MRRDDFLRAAGGAAAGLLWNGSALCAAGAEELPPLRLGLAEGDDATPTLYALRAGLFKKYGVNVQFSKAPSGAEALAALAGGSLDIAGTSLLPFFSAYSRGLPLQLVAPLAVSTPDSAYAVVLVKQDAPYKTGRDLNGKTIASSALKDLNWLATMAWIDGNGGDISTVRAVEIPASATAAALETGRIDAATVTTPRYVQALASGGVRILGKAYQAIAKHFTFAAMAARSEYANKNRDVIERFGRAIYEATLYTNAHHAETLPIYAAFAHIDPKQIENAPRAISAPYLDAQDIEPLINAAVRYKVLARPIDASTLISAAALKRGAAA